MLDNVFFDLKAFFAIVVRSPSNFITPLPFSYLLEIIATSNGLEI
jgi:hypothetical protein